MAWLDSLWGRREYSWDVSDAFSVSSAAKINETDTFGPGDDDEIQFDDIADDDEDIDDVSWRNWTIFFLYILSTWISSQQWIIIPKVVLKPVQHLELNIKN